ncbi:LysR family transcriptional regulator [Allopusillimonas soli]|uniref:LysR family transcriptional regulator n=1 Tax=Allopusillimonas soli TaxID=659016 RepID=A0A853FG12_9BURK|nr:LysR substrate-binding domain-containing protein [Allopusillimonas soli]NYT38827.1 LysR family transcriptional regulator [Allopusillimonas soli]TEA70197.1 LysR family transcriptional regulator [Allopusillimonas soli]
MELRHLRYFIAVAEYESVRVASERIHITQPAISRQIQDLEAELGVSLFVRTKRGLRLTEAGAVFLAEARQILSHLEAAVGTTRQVASGVEGHLRVGFVENAGWDGVVPAIFNRFQQEAHKVSIELVPLYTPAQLETIENRSLDGGFVYLFDPLPEKFSVLSLCRHDVMLAVPRTWDMPENEAVAMCSLIGKPFITFQRGVYPAYYDRLIAACVQAGLTPNVVQEVTTEAAILSLVSAGVGAAIVNAANLGRPPAQAKFVPVAGFSMPLPLAFVHLADNANPALARFLTLLRDYREDAAALP